MRDGREAAFGWAVARSAWLRSMCEIGTGNLNAQWQGGTVQRVDGGDAKDGHVFVYITGDWRDTSQRPPPFKVSKRDTLPIHVAYLGPEHQLLQFTAVIVLRGRQCGALHLQIVGHIRQWLWSMTDAGQTRRLVEGSGMADYLNIIWCAPARMELYREATSEFGFCEYEWGVEDESWDGFWYIYRRNYPTPSYAHIGLDKSASLKAQKHVADEVRGEWSE